MKRKIRDSLVRMALNMMQWSGSYRLFHPNYSGVGMIFMFHRITSRADDGRFINSELEVTPEELEKCITYCFKKDYEIISLDEMYIFLKEKKFDHKVACFTFDDGYIDTYTQAYPLFKKYQLPFAVNITTGFPDKSVIIWWYILEELLQKNDIISFKLNGKAYSYKCANKIAKNRVFHQIRRLIIESDRDEYESKIRQIFAPYKIDLHSKTEELALTWEQIREMSRDPLVTIAAHTVHHYPLNRLSPEEVIKEIMDSKDRLESQLGIKIEHFAYPFGQLEAGAREFALLKECGLKTGTTTRFATIFPEHADFLECLPRIYKIWGIPKVKYLEVFASGALSALIYRFKKVVTE